MIETHVGDCREVLPALPPGSVHMVVTSPPYRGLRDYGTASWEGGNDPDCDHKIGSYRQDEGKRTWGGGAVRGGDRYSASPCTRCGARRIDSQIGLEETPAEYLETMVGVFRHVWRVLRDDGTLWLNMGDGYAGGGRGGNPDDFPFRKQATNRGSLVAPSKLPVGLKPKDLIGMPWRLALALQAEGWYLRSDIIWAKSNPMPESCTDRPTKSHEYVFLLTKKPVYFYDAEAIREPGTIEAGTRAAKGSIERFEMDGVNSRPPEYKIYDGTRNKRTVWTIPTHSFDGAHFATFPPDLVKPCILAGTSARGVCPECGAPWERIVAKESAGDWNEQPGSNDDSTKRNQNKGKDACGGGKTTGWRPGCDHEAKGLYLGAVPATVLDPFSGSGTVGAVALELGRRAVLIELNPEYAKLSGARTNVTPGLPGLA